MHNAKYTVQAFLHPELTTLSLLTYTFTVQVSDDSPVIPINVVFFEPYCDPDEQMAMLVDRADEARVEANRAYAKYGVELTSIGHIPMGEGNSYE